MFLLITVALAQSPEVVLDAETAELTIELYGDEAFLVEEDQTRLDEPFVVDANQGTYVCLPAKPDTAPCLDRGGECTRIDVLSEHDGAWCGWSDDLAATARNGIGMDRSEAERAQIRLEKRLN